MCIVNFTVTLCIVNFTMHIIIQCNALNSSPMYRKFIGYNIIYNITLSHCKQNINDACALKNIDATGYNIIYNIIKVDLKEECFDDIDIDEDQMQIRKYFDSCQQLFF